MKDLKLYCEIDASPEEVYQALVNPMAVKTWTNDPEAIMQEEIDSEFELFEGGIAGKNIAFEPNKRIVQEWYFGEDHPHSLVTLTLHLKGSGTSLEIRQQGIPSEAYEDILEGWKYVYLANLQAFFEED